MRFWCAVAVRRLAALGCRIVEADSGVAALAVLEAGEPVDILFSDVVMAGGMTGFELANRAREWRPDLRVVLTSGYTDPAMIKDGQMPADARWLAKPYSLDDLEAALRPAGQAGRTGAANR